MVEIKHIDFIDTVPIMPCQNSLWIMGLRVYGEKRTHIFLISPAMMGLYWHKKLLAIQGIIV